MPSATRSAAPRGILIAAVLLAGACAGPGEYGLRRVGGGELATIEIGGVARPAVPVAAVAGRAPIPLADLTAGELVLWLGSAEPVGDAAHVRIALEAHDVRTALGWEPFGAACTLRWLPDEASRRWHECRIPIARACARAELLIEYDGPPDAAIYVSEPWLLGTRRPAGPDVVVLVLDTVRADRLRSFGGRVPIGDALAQLAEDSLVLRNVRSSSSWTRPAVATLLTGLRAGSHRVYDRLDVLPHALTTLPEILRDAGYLTLGWSANVNVLPMWGFAQGFDAFVDAGAQTWVTAKTDAAALADLALAGIADSPDVPSLFYVHFMDAHAPYAPRSADLEAVEAIEDLPATFPRPLAVMARLPEFKLYRQYLGELRDLDREIGRVLSFLKETGRYERSLILVASDHGEEFLDHGRLYHGRSLYDEVLRVPVLIKPPAGTVRPGEVAAPVAFADLMPTILDLVDARGSVAMDGRSLVVERGDGPTPGQQQEPRFALAPWLAEAPGPQFAELRLDGVRQSAVTLGPWKLIVAHGAGMSFLYNLAEDPEERQNLVASAPEVATQLRAILDAEDARQEAGWHVMACGAPATEATIRLAIDGAGDPPARRRMEDEDVVTTSGERLLVTFTLPPRETQVERMGNLIDVVTRDEDEIVLRVAETAPTLRAVEGQAIPLAVGDVAPQPTTELALSTLRDRAAVRNHVRPACHEHPEAHLRVWLVEPPESLDAAEVDPAIADRLRALGYLK